MPVPLLAMSTSWCIRRSPLLGPALDAIQDLGFRYVELNNLTPPMVAELADQVAHRGMAIQSIHNPCPWPADGAGEPVAWSRTPELSSPEASERARAVAVCKGTIDLAQATGSRAVIVHLGHVPDAVPQRQLFELLRSGQAAEFAALRERAVADREERKLPYLQAALAGIRELGEYAAGRGVSLGVETRDGYNEIPSLDEFEEVLAAAEGLPVYYWHDVGHAHKQHRLGLAGQEEYLRRYGGRLLGVHLHDALLERDHLAPGLGEVDLAAVAGMLPRAALRTLELGSPETVADVRAAMEILKGLGLS